MEESIFANLDQYRSDEKLETEGRPVELAPGITVWVRRAGGFNRRRWNAALLMLRDSDDIPEDHPDRATEIEYLAAARVLVARWEGIEDADAVAIPCTPGNAVQLFREFPDWFAEITSTAYDQEGYRRQDAVKSL
jgi:hypothetical protein